uniref:uncharacterized protein LOC120338163 n=1 Tax=Styela clava TaxID=7725 RepID=UPI001939FF6F|nr:uncharacterized protein LOC120338163 [Styela clava]
MNSTTLFIFIGLVVLISTNTTYAKKHRISPKIREMICRRCWGRLYKYCSGSVRLSKRSVDDDTEEITSLARNFQGSSMRKQERSWLSRVKAEVYSRRKRRAYRTFRIQIKNCKVCRDICF